MLDMLKFSQVKDHREVVVSNENSKSVNGKLNSEFRSHEKFINYIPKLNGAEINEGNEIFFSKQTKTKYVKLMANCNLKNMAAVGLNMEAVHIYVSLTII
jgi:hypothetical protein